VDLFGRIQTVNFVRHLKAVKSTLTNRHRTLVTANASAAFAAQSSGSLPPAAGSPEQCLILDVEGERRSGVRIGHRRSQGCLRQPQVAQTGPPSDGGLTTHERPATMDRNELL
jgi:hypothetical protein